MSLWLLLMIVGEFSVEKYLYCHHATCEGLHSSRVNPPNYYSLLYLYLYAVCEWRSIRFFYGCREIQEFTTRLGLYKCGLSNVECLVARNVWKPVANPVFFVANKARLMFADDAEWSYNRVTLLEHDHYLERACPSILGLRLMTVDKYVAALQN